MKWEELSAKERRSLWLFENIYRRAFWLFWCLVGLISGYFLNFFGMLLFTVIVTVGAIIYGTLKKVDLMKSEPGMLAFGVALATLTSSWVLFWVIVIVWGKSFAFPTITILDIITR